ncbi:hypothetical protein ACJQWK_04196 [Exserohilum turcicum]|uniref:Uncharacterized protein n=1 Tax=Exserohilum turcicum (strain 28A) TaxID=671987 RepID=R0KV20_EXST2|nr:uncharacterized protein SETTUDRAFT_30121 [Exserohilum turcica Et28A]EOA91592.1 hypothetical protein SETTUDRAFT_30121 [Exserohilum turcica Et28A]
MAPKKASKKAPKKAPKLTPEAEAQKRIRGEEYPVLVQGSNHITFEKLKNQLAARQQEQRDAAASLPALIREHTRLLKAGDQAALKSWLQGAGKEVTRKHCDTQRLRFCEAQRDLEDFLYYQNPIHRRKRPRDLKKKPTATDIHGRERGPPIYNLAFSHKNIEQLLNMYDKTGIGSVNHRNGKTDWGGQPIPSKKGDSRFPPVRPNELHLWTPPARRRPVGSVISRNAPTDVDDFALDADAITEVWKRIEETNIPEEGFPYQTHAERRRQEREIYRTDPHARPTTSFVHTEETPSGTVTVDPFIRMQTREGIFIAALESSYDWRTSYDCLGPVKSVTHQNFTISEEREMIEGPPEDDPDGQEDAPDLSEKPDAPDAPDNTEEAASAASPVQTRSSAKNKKKGGHAGSKKKGASKSAAKPNAPPAKPLTSIDYPYPAWEFEGEDPPGRRKIIDDKDDLNLAPIATDWCEETCGRREWHVNMLLSPASSVDSPPHSPIEKPEEWEGRHIPDTFPDEKLPVISEAVKRRCPHKPERCRAWWTHAPDECWLVQSWQVPPENSSVVRPRNEISAPEIFELPESGRSIYEERTHDHYGLSGVGTATWPRVGVRVPYEPTTFDDLKSPLENSNIATQESVGAEASSKVAFEVHALAAPLIPMSPRDYHGVGVTESSEGAEDAEEYEEDSDSDYENDVFYHEYMKLSGEGN